MISAAPRVALPVAALGINQHRHALRPGRGDHGLDVDQRAFVIVRTDERVGFGQRGFDASDQRVAIEDGPGGERLLEIQPDQLLIAAHHAQFGHGRAIRADHERGRDAGLAEQLAHRGAGVVVADHADERGAHAGAHEIERYVGSTAQAPLLVIDPHHRHGRFRRDARGIAVPVTIEHDVAYHQHARVLERGNRQHSGFCPGGVLPHHTKRSPP